MSIGNLFSFLFIYLILISKIGFSFVFVNQFSTHNSLQMSISSSYMSLTFHSDILRIRLLCFELIRSCSLLHFCLQIQSGKLYMYSSNVPAILYRCFGVLNSVYEY